MTQLLSGLAMQTILDWQSVREAEVGLERGENTSSLQHCHFCIAAVFYTISSLCWCIVEVCFITTDLFFIKTNSLYSVSLFRVFHSVNTQKLLRKCSKSCNGITFGNSWLFPFSRYGIPKPTQDPYHFPRSSML